MKQYFIKFLTSGGYAPIRRYKYKGLRSFRWSLKTKKEVAEMCQSGWHACSEIGLFDWINRTLCIMETGAEVINSKDKYPPPTIYESYQQEKIVTPGPVRLMCIPYSQKLANEICEYLGVLSIGSTNWYDFFEYMTNWDYYCYNCRKINGLFLETHKEFQESMSFLISSYLISRFVDNK